MKVAASILATVIASASSFVVQPQNTRLADTFLAARKPFITGNWKLNPTTKAEAIELATGIANAVTDSSPGDVALFVPYPYLESVEAAVDGKVTIGAEVRASNLLIGTSSTFTLCLVTTDVSLVT